MNITLVINEEEATVLKKALIVGRSDLRKKLDESVKEDEESYVNDIIISHRISELLNQLTKD